jgi:hypothetical protein
MREQWPNALKLSQWFEQREAIFMLRSRLFWCGVLAGLCVCAAAAAAAATPDSVPAIDSIVAPASPLTPPLATTSPQLAVGLVVDVQGKGKVIAKNGSATPLELLQYLGLESRIELEAGSKASISHYASRSVYQLTGPSVTQVKADGLFTSEGIQAVVDLKAQPLLGGSRVPRLVPGGPKLYYKRPDIFLESIEGFSPVLFDRETQFQWPGKQADAYRLILSDSSGKQLMRSAVQGKRLRLPANVPLTPGQEYQWKVSAIKGKRIETTEIVNFRLADRFMQDEIVALRPGDDAPVAELVLYAILLEERYLSTQARAVWTRIAARRPALEQLRPWAR